LRRLEEQLLSNDAKMADEVERQVAIAMSQQHNHNRLWCLMSTKLMCFSKEAAAFPWSSLSITRLKPASSTILWMISLSGHLVHYKVNTRA
jgi:hypothetical protein